MSVGTRKFVSCIYELAQRPMNPLLLTGYVADPLFLPSNPALTAPGKGPMQERWKGTHPEAPSSKAGCKIVSVEGPHFLNEDVY